MNTNAIKPTCRSSDRRDKNVRDRRLHIEGSSASQAGRTTAASTTASPCVGHLSGMTKCKSMRPGADGKAQWSTMPNSGSQ